MWLMIGIAWMWKVQFWSLINKVINRLIGCISFLYAFCSCFINSVVGRYEQVYKVGLKIVAWIDLDSVLKRASVGWIKNALNFLFSDC